MIVFLTDVRWYLSEVLTCISLITSNFEQLPMCLEAICVSSLEKCLDSSSLYEMAYSVQFVQELSRVQLFATPWTAACQASLSKTNSWSLLRLMSIESMMPSKHLILCHPFLLPPTIFPALGSFPLSPFFTSGGQNIEVSVSASVLTMNIQDWFPLGLTVGSPCSPRDSQESSPTHQFKSISSSMLSFLHSPTLTSTHDYWKNHSFD